MISITELVRYAAAYPEAPPRTTALEQRIKIGTGFHGKWYRSQKEHALAWLVFQECQARTKGRDPEQVSAKEMWNRLHCAPSLIWYAEASGISPDTLDEAEIAAERAAAKIGNDHPSHGKLVRRVLPWTRIEIAVPNGPTPLSAEEARAEATAAFNRLSTMRSEFRKYREFL